MCQQSFFLNFFFWIFSHNSVIFYDWRFPKKLFSFFCWKMFQLFTTIASVCDYLPASVSFLVSIHFTWSSFFLCRLAFIQSANILFTPCSIGLHDCSLFSFSLPLNVIHSIKWSINFSSDGLSRKTFLQQNGCQIYNFISLSLLLNTKWYLFWYQFFQNFSYVYIQKHNIK